MTYCWQCDCFICCHLRFNHFDTNSIIFFTASICEQQQQQNQSSSYSHNRVLLLSTLMPNMASGDQSKQRSSSSEEHHHHHSEEHLSSIELFTDIESLLRQINHLLAIDQRANDDNDQKKVSGGLRSE